MRRTFLVGLAVLLILLVSGGVAWSKTVVAVGLDLTATYRNQAEAKKVIAGLIVSLKPGDVLYLQTIVAKSYGPDCSVLRVEIPRPMERPKNKYARRQWAAYRASLGKIRAVKINAIRTLALLKPTQTKLRDIYGFLHAASDKLAAEPTKAKKLILVASNMRPSVQYKSNPNLKGVSVHIVAFSSGNDVDYVNRLKRTWRRILKKSFKAAEVRFFPVGVKYELAAD